MKKQAHRNDGSTDADGFVLREWEVRPVDGDRLAWNLVAPAGEVSEHRDRVVHIAHCRIEWLPIIQSFQTLWEWDIEDYVKKKDSWEIGFKYI